MSPGTAQKLEEEEEAAMERADIVNQMARRTKAVEAYKKLFNDIVRDWKDERNASSGMSLCLRPSISAMAMKALLMIGP